DAARSYLLRAPRLVITEESLTAPNTSGHRRLQPPSRARERPIHSLLGCATAVNIEPSMPGQVTRPSASNSDSHRIGTEAVARARHPGVPRVIPGRGIG